MTATFISDLIRDYLADADSITAGVPDNTTLKKQSLSDTKMAKPPRLLVAVDADPEKKHPAKIVFVVDVVITAEAVLDVRATVEGWMKAVRQRMAALQDFADWIEANRTEEQRTGWQIARLRLFASEEEFSADDDSKTYSLSLPMRLTVYIA